MSSIAILYNVENDYGSKKQHPFCKKENHLNHPPTHDFGFKMLTFQGVPINFPWSCGNVGKSPMVAPRKSSEVLGRVSFVSFKAAPKKISEIKKGKAAIHLL